MKNLKIIFAGTPDFAVPALEELIASSHQVVAVYTQPDRPAGRGRKIITGPIKKLALKHHIPVEQPITLRDSAAQDHLRTYQADMMIVAAYGLILPPSVLNMPRYGCINIHASILPRWRGAAPIQRAILAGDQITGVTIMQMAEGLDTGPMLLTASCPINADDTTAILHDRLATFGAKTLLQFLDLHLRHEVHPEEQDNTHATYAEKINKAEAEINWRKPAHLIDRKIRAFNPWPVAFTHYKNDIIRIWQAKPLLVDHEAKPGTILKTTNEGIDVACGENALRIEKLQFPGGKVLNAADVIHGKRLTENECLS
ncbi:MAG: methionyl-tRNA formyltransferase [Gammaproteobacteria bacterium]